MRLCPNDGTELEYVDQGIITIYYKCPMCAERFEGFAGDSDTEQSAEKK